MFNVFLFDHSVKTPSYQGLKFLGDLLQLKETAILSDSDPELTMLHLDSPTNVLACSGKSNRLNLKLQISQGSVNTYFV